MMPVFARRLEPEWLDSLPPDDPRATGSRRDLMRINQIMRQPAIMAHALLRHPPPATLADLGGGDGRFTLAVARRLARYWPGVCVFVHDRQSIVAPQTHAAFETLGWRCEVHQGDIFEILPQADIVMANLFLHHLADAELARLITAVAERATSFVACEPRRSRFALLGARLLWALGCNAVTRHDAIVSVQAGFANRELSGMWPRTWSVEEYGAFPFTHVISAHMSSDV